MGANSANGKIYISAEVIDNFKQLASEVKNGLRPKNINLVSKIIIPLIIIKRSGIII